MITKMYLSFFMIGKLVNNIITVKKNKEASRLHNKSRFGKILHDGRLQLNLLEGLFLLENRKLHIFHNGELIGFQILFELAMRDNPRFEMGYLVFRDLRRKGYLIGRTNNNTYFDFSVHRRKNPNDNDVIEKKCRVVVFSERETFRISEVKRALKVIKKDAENLLWFVVVDEEGDLTYYNVDFVDPHSSMKPCIFLKGTGLLTEDRVLLFDEKLGRQLMEKEFFGKPFSEGLQVSFVEAIYLLEKNILKIREITTGEKLSLKGLKDAAKHVQPDIESRFRVYRDLKERGLIVKTGFKFGAHFRAYEKDPQLHHAEYLVDVVKKDFTDTWSAISRGIRLAHSVKKLMVFALLDNRGIEYVLMSRLRL